MQLSRICQRKDFIKAQGLSWIRISGAGSGFAFRGLVLSPRLIANSLLFSIEKGKGRRSDPCFLLTRCYRVDSISKPQASSRGSGMYLEFLLRRAHSRSRVERKY